jgi:MFS family permease
MASPYSEPFLARGYRARLLAVLMFANTLNFADRAILSAVAEPMRLDLGLSDVQIGLLQGLAFAITYSVVGIPVGWLAERKSRLKLLAGCVIFFSAATGLCGFATSFVQLFILRILVGVGEGSFMAPASSLLADHYPGNRRASALGIVMLGTPVGFFVGSLLGGFAAETLGWRATFQIMSIPGFFVALLLLFALKEPPRGLADNIAPRKSAPPRLWTVFRHLSGQPSFRHILAGAVLCTCAANAIGQFQFIFLVRTYGLTLSQAGALSGTISLVALGIGMVFGGSGSDHLERRDRRWYLWLPAIGVALAAMCYACGFALSSLWWTAGFLMMGGIFFATYFAPTYSLVQNIAGVHMRASAIAIFGVFTGLLGAGLGPTITGAVSDWTARKQFAMGSFDTVCRGGRAFSSPEALDRACQAASAAGMRGALIVVCLLFVWAALHFLLAARTIQQAMIAGEKASRPAPING